MLKFLCFVSVLGISIGAYAQDNGLFPELNKRQEQSEPAAVQQPVPAGQVPSLFADEAPVSREEIIEQARQKGLNDLVEPGADSLSERLSAGQKKVAAGQDGYFVLSPARVQIIEPSIARFQFCMADLSLTNNTDKALSDLSVTVHYSPINMPFSFGSVPVGETVSRQFYMASEGCQKLIQVPQLTINNCVAEDMTEEECKSAVKYVTELQLVSDLQQ